MKSFTMLLLAAATLMMAPNAMAQTDKGTAYGKTFTAKDPKTPEEVVSSLGDKATVSNITVKGEISEVCQAEGCWMKLKSSNGNLLVKFKDHSFLVPKDLAGKTAVVYGTAMKKTVSVKERQHMAEDAGATKEEIAAITTPKDEVRIEATGIVVN